MLAPKFGGQPFGTLDLGLGFKAAFAAGANPVDGVGPFGDEAGLGAPGDDELAGATAASDAVNDDGFLGRVVLVHEGKELVDLLVARDAVVRDVDEVVVKALGDILTVVEFTNVDDGFDAFLIEDIEDVGIGPPGGGDDVFDDPREGFGALGLPAFGPVGRANGHGVFSIRGVWKRPCHWGSRGANVSSLRGVE